MSSPHVAVTVVGNDRPGIVAGVTEVLYEKGCNLEDATSTILRGHFAMMLVVRVPDGSSAEELESALADASGKLGVTITVRAVEEAPAEVPAPSHMVSVYGSDRPGIVFHVARALTDAGANITDLTSRVIGEEEAPLYALMLEVGCPEGADLERALAATRSELGVEI